MANNDNESRKGTPGSVPPGSSPKKPSAIIDLKPTGVEITGGEKKPEATAEKPAAPVSQAGSSAEGKPAAPGGTAVPAAGATTPKPGDAPRPASEAAGAPATAAGGGKPDDKAKTSTVTGNGDRMKPGPAAEPVSKAPTAASPGSGSKPTAPPPAGSSFTSFMTHLAAGIAGGMLALIGADSINSQLIGNRSDMTGSTTEVSARLAALEQRASANTGQRDVEALEKRLVSAESRLTEVTALEGRIAAMRKTQEILAKETDTLAAAMKQSGAAGQGPEYQERLSRLEEQLRTLAMAGSDGGKQSGPIPQLAAITGKIADLESSLASRLAAIEKSVQQELDTRTQKIAETGEAARAGTIRLDRELSGLKSGTEKLGDTVAKLDASQSRANKSIAELRSERDALASEIAAIRQRIQKELQSVARPSDVKQAVSPISTALSSIEQRLDSVVNREQERQSAAERILLAIELSNLKRAVDRGDSYATELAAVGRLGTARLDLAGLEKFKEHGVPSVQNLAAEFRPLTYQIIAADNASKDETIIGRLMSGAKSVVRVRRVGDDVEGDGAEAVVARMEAALDKGQLNRVVELSSALSEKAMIPAAKEWLDKVRARASVLAAINNVEAQLKSAIGSGSAKAGKAAEGTAKQ
ncbi:MAG: hypothetical protein RLZ98_3384 [Pseudomonadota bacterium]|jgi:hypothetical protein